MWNKLTNSNVFYAVLAVFFAIIFWFYVDLARSPDARVSINYIPVTLVGTDIPEEQGLMILSESQTINISVSGPRRAISKLNRDNVTITASAADINEAGTYSLACNITLPSSVTSVSANPVRVVSRSAGAIEVTAVKMVSKQVPIHAVFTGTVGADRYYDESSFQLSQDELTISGEEAVVSAVSYAQVTLQELALTSTWSGWLDVELFDQDGNLLPKDNLSLEADSISTSFEVTCIKEVPLELSFLAGAGATTENVTYELTPTDRIKISGEESILETLDKIDLGTVDLSQIVTSEEFTFDVVLPENIKNQDHIATVTALVTLVDLETKRMTASNIRVLNAPEDLECTASNLEVRVRGSVDDFDLLMPADILVTVDLSGMDLKAGETVSVPAEIEIVGFAELGVVGSYKVEVQTKEKVVPAEDGAQTGTLDRSAWE